VNGQTDCNCPHFAVNDALGSVDMLRRFLLKINDVYRERAGKSSQILVNGNRRQLTKSLAILHGLQQKRFRKRSKLASGTADV